MDEIRILKEEIRRAERNPNRTSPQRRKAYRSVLQLAKSSDASSKKFATDTLKDFFADFPEYQDEAINTVYDLCEDPDRDTRLAGYRALASLSRADRKWVVRIVDVLVQLLQIDDLDEVAVVKSVLQEHIDLDAPRTFKVLCNQCTFDMDSMHREEIERLRSLVINFLKERYRYCVDRVVKRDEVWDVLFNGLLKAIPQALSSEVVTIIRDILTHTPQLSISSYRDGATKLGNVVLDDLLQNAKAVLKTEVGTSGVPSTIPRTCMFLALAAYITTPLSYTPPHNGSRVGIVPIIDRTQKLPHSSTASADSYRLIRFYLSLLGSEGLLKPQTLQKLTKRAATRIAWYVARAWEGCEDMMNGTRKMVGCSKPDLYQARNALVDLSPKLFSIVSQKTLRHVSEGRHHRRAAHALMRACVDRERSTKEAWAAPDGFEESLHALLTVASTSSADEVKDARDPHARPDEYVGEESELTATPESTMQSLKEIENLIRSLLDAKGEDEKGIQTVSSGMEIDAPAVSTSPISSRTAEPTNALKQLKHPSSTALDVINERRREFGRNRQGLDSPKSHSSQDNSMNRRVTASPLPDSLSVRGAASLAQQSSSSRMGVDGSRQLISVENHQHQQTPDDDSTSRPLKRAKSLSAHANTTNTPAALKQVSENAIARTPSLLSRLQLSDDPVWKSNELPSLASRLFSPPLTIMKSASAVELHEQSSRDHRSRPTSAMARVNFLIKGQAGSVTNVAAATQGYPATTPSSDGLAEFKIRGAAHRDDGGENGGKLTLLDRLQGSSITSDMENKSKKRKRGQAVW